VEDLGGLLRGLGSTPIFLVSPGSTEQVMLPGMLSCCVVRYYVCVSVVR